jgi:pyruvate/2-oxoglutarate dehydrogenase complex dihydrolipoamide dehydrogenase (E3) component
MLQPRRAKTAVIERHHFGGTCVNVGCVPTKTLVASARVVRLVQRGAEFGFDMAGLRVDMARVIARENTIFAKFREGVETWVRGLKNTRSSSATPVSSVRPHWTWADAA